ncbi:hypothetical protein HP439_15505 [Sphingobacterium shayense]|uniref:hypothetical protein n=1 Tax=Sphingobacterium shayense TaxID=626343 RepID=UPI001555D221|nr:hypothetical protein [Sphingobacterium shayense]NQD72132.1 hypothetical protein [Sphingobacterium shayense]
MFSDQPCEKKVQNITLERQNFASEDLSPWLYNGGSKGKTADLGYYIGYEICKSYYNNALDKKRAVKDIIELNYDDNIAVDKFLVKSNYLETAK